MNRSWLTSSRVWVPAGAVVLLVGAFLFFRREPAVEESTTFVAQRGPLRLTVLEGGSMEALESQDIKCEVRGYQGVKILKIVEEGTQVTEDDVRTNRVLVELDSSELKKQLTQQDISLESSLASLVEARQSFDIQLNQNYSDIKAAEQKSRFARMDLEKFLGDQVTKELMRELGAEEGDATALTEKSDSSAAMEAARALAESATHPRRTNAPGAEATLPSAAPERARTRSAGVDFARYAKAELLGDGEAQQKLRKLDEDVQVAQRELALARSNLEGTEKLFGRGFTTKNDVEVDQIKVENNRLKMHTAETARSLFIKYEFPKSAEEFYSKHAEAVRELGRTRKGAVSKMAQAEAKVKSAEGRFNLESKARSDLTNQMDKCLIRARQPGLVVYGGAGRQGYYYYGQERIREGSLVREQQPILTIPDLSKMSVKVSIHETYIKKVSKGQKVRITLDAFADKRLDGVVSKVSLLPDSDNRWMNPDMKVYSTSIAVAGAHDWLKPGMSAKVEIMVKELSDVVYVPIQAVSPGEGKQFCFVVQGGRPERRAVEVGDFNDEFIEIKSGLQEGERVGLRSPPTPEAEEKKPGPEPESTPKPAAAPVASAAPPSASP